MTSQSPRIQGCSIIYDFRGKFGPTLVYSLYMADGYSWNYARGHDSNKLPGPEHLGWWAALALILSIALHGAVFFVLERMEIAWSFQQAKELSTASVDFRQVEIRSIPEQLNEKPEDIAPIPDDSATLLEEIDFLNALPKDQEIDLSTEIDQASYALKMSQPDVGGQAPVERLDPAAGVDIDFATPEVGSEPKILPPAEVGQVVIDSGASPGVDDGVGAAQEILKAGQGDGSNEGIASLEDLLKLPPNLLLSKKTRLPSDLLFEFNSSELRESARLGLMKLALLMDRNPGLYCWIEGHTDLIGGDAFNMKLSKARAEAVKTYLVQSMRMDPKRIIARGFGRRQPIVASGDQNAQAPNRRVEIRMRKTPPGAGPEAALPKPKPLPPEPKPVLIPPKAKPTLPPEPVLIPPKAEPVAPKAEPVPPKAGPVLIKPRRAQPVEPVDPTIPPKAEPANPPKAEPVPPRAEAVPPRAETVEE